jgi:glycosyltransferase involved in cell wall biosynthesis/SAM-dependent methyltransferase
MKIHVLGVPHTQTTKRFSTCAFTQKTRNLCSMLSRRGHTVYHYGVEGSVVEAEHITVASIQEFEKAYGHPGNDFYAHDKETPERNAYLYKWAANTNKELQLRSGEPMTEIIAITFGGFQRIAASSIPQFQVETGIGYRHVECDNRVYESYAWMHMHLGEKGLFSGEKWYWAVIPNSFDLNDFEPNFEPRSKDAPFLYLGRLNIDKGVGLAVDITRRIGAKLLIVGQGEPHPDWMQPHVTRLPPVEPKERAALLASVQGVICMSYYVEPFCGVAVEAGLSGTPVISSDWGAMGETIQHGVTGFRCRTMEHMTWAAKHLSRIDPRDCYNWTSSNYSLERVAPMYEEFFDMVLATKGPGFYQERTNRRNLDWLKRVYPKSATAAWSYNPDLSAYEVPIAPLKSEWDAAQEYERDWWGLEWSSKWDDEIRKQETYFRLMNLPAPAAHCLNRNCLRGSPAASRTTAQIDPSTFRPEGCECECFACRSAGQRDFTKKKILDVGCGPVSLLQRSHHGKSRGVDPLAVNEATRKRYRDADVEFLNIKAEDMPVDQIFDEAWLYNVLQHTDDPKLILSKVCRSARLVRIFEWIDLGVCPGHPQNLTEELFSSFFETPDWTVEVWNIGFLKGFGGTVTEKYIAIVAVRRSEPPL